MDGGDSVIYGYTGKILEVNLTDGTIQKTPLPVKDAQRFLGARGIMTKLLWERLKPETKPFSPENLIMFFTGPLTGLLSGNRTIIRFKSPLSATSIGQNLMGHTSTGGNWGPELKQAGFDGVIIKGRAEKPVYLFVNNGDAEIRRAKHLWGNSIFETEVKLKKEIDPFARVLQIGPAGENLVRYACINQEYFYSASRCGGGAVMGSKHLKAIAVRGTLDIPVYSVDELISLEEKVHTMLRSDETYVYGRKRWGSTTANISSSDSSTGPLKNWREAYWNDEIEKGGPLQWEARCRVKNRGCYGCSTPCNQLGIIREGPWAGTFDIPDYDSTDLLHPNCMMTDPNGVYALSSFLDSVGLDSISTGNTLSWTMECYEKGILSNEDLDKIELTWGNVDAMFQMVRKIVRREGIGDLLAEGIRIASEKIGKGSEKFAMHCKGVEWGVGGAGNNRDQRETFCYVMSDRGGSHLYGTTIEGQNDFAIADVLTLCIRNVRYLDPKTIGNALNAATGWDYFYTREEWDHLAHRLLILERAWNVKHGLVPERDDVLPERVFTEPLTLGPKAGTPAAIYDRKQFENDKQTWYKARGCDSHGIPLKTTLKNLDLSFVIPDLEKKIPLEE
ncbi:MAG: aldehyde ferredoxin oxidoreductase family protein [Candidatus Bathyarchaeota archaeon]|nr:MAG: aldehyde ferredoxin oxidoreductase family protein [Candidatus Bathyarchaeota archaeon]